MGTFNPGLFVEMILTFFLIMDPVGNAVITVAILKEFPVRRQRRIIFREMVIALLIILVFTFIGDFFLNLLNIGPSTLRVAGGIILFIISLKMVFPRSDEFHEPSEGDPFIVPIAVPFIAGPSLIAAVMLYAHRQGGGVMVPGAVLTAWIATTAIMVFSPTLKRVLGQRGLRAAERLMGLLLIFLSVQMLEDGIRLFITSL
ncbi:MAG: MarC family protein [Desulfovibrionales bacterium]